MDFYRLKNIQADTDMRKSVSEPPASPASGDEGN
jgi:uncharacterized protein YqfA (UPF0365 family)